MKTTLSLFIVLIWRCGCRGVKHLLHCAFFFSSFWGGWYWNLLKIMIFWEGSWPYSFPSVAGMMVVSIFFFFLFVFVWSPGTFICIFPTRAMAAAWPVGFFRGINTHGFGKDKKYSCSLLNLPRFVPGLLSSCLPKVGCWPMAVYETCLFWHAALSSAGPLSFAMSQSCTLQVFERFEGSSEREEHRLRIHTINL